MLQKTRQAWPVEDFGLNRSTGHTGRDRTACRCGRKPVVEHAIVVRELDRRPQPGPPGRAERTRCCAIEDDTAGAAWLAGNPGVPATRPHRRLCARPDRSAQIRVVRRRRRAATARRTPREVRLSRAYSNPVLISAPERRSFQQRSRTVTGLIDAVRNCKFRDARRRLY